MKMNELCLPCFVNQVIKIVEMTNAPHRESIYRDIFEYMSKMDFSKSNPEIIGETFQKVIQYVGKSDPYYELRHEYNRLFLNQIDYFDSKIGSFNEAIKYAIIGNIIEFSPIHQNVKKDITESFQHIDKLELAIDDSDELLNDLQNAQTLLYIGDNCGEICLDRLLLKRIKELYPHLDIYFAVRGQPVVNDSIAEDAYEVGIDRYATIISNGDSSLGTVLHRTSPEFQSIYQQSDVVMAKGQANYESLSEEKKNIYFLLIVK